MQAHGSDRVRRGNGEQWVLFTPHSKGWVARVPPTLIARERPGSTVSWDGEYFEVVSATASGTGVRYVLEPWREEHVMRTVDAYDETSEQTRDLERGHAIRQDRSRRTANLLGIFTGHLPAAVQQRMASELGILSTRLTALSLLLPVLVIAFIANEQARRMLAREGNVSFLLLIFAGYLGLESAVRLNIVWAQSRPIGSAAGFLVYALYFAVARNRSSLPRPVEAPSERVQLEVPADVAVRDAFTIREPLFTLLSAAEQRLAAERFGYDYRRSAPLIAVVILVTSIAGAVSSSISLRHGMAMSPLLSLIVASGLAIEQVFRLEAMRRGPAGSVLGFLVRPLTRM